MTDTGFTPGGPCAWHAGSGPAWGSDAASSFADVGLLVQGDIPSSKLALSADVNGILPSVTMLLCDDTVTRNS